HYLHRRHGSGATRIQADRVSKRARVWEKPPGKCLVDHRHSRRTFHIPIGQVSSGDDLSAERREPSFGDQISREPALKVRHARDVQRRGESTRKRRYEGERSPGDTRYRTRRVTGSLEFGQARLGGDPGPAHVHGDDGDWVRLKAKWT